jgi:hypothetical protein
MKVLRLLLVPISLIIWTNNDISAGSEAQGSFKFYGHQVQIIYDYNFLSLDLSQSNQQSINSLLNRFRNHNLHQTVDRIEKHKEFFKLDDVGVVLLIDLFLDQALKQKGQNEKAFVKYLILKQMGYDVLLTRTSAKLNCMGNLSFIPGRYLYITYNNKVYKDLDFKNRTNGGKHLIYMDQVKTYKTINRDILRLPKINAKISEKKLQFTHAGTDYELLAKSNESVLEFLNDLPMYSIGNEYTSLSMSSELNQSLMPYLRSHIAGMSKTDAASFLLSFVQQCTPYGSDYDKYGEERFYYPEETVMASTADCEDKTFLMAYLSKRLLGVKAVGLFFEYDEHLSIGLELPDYSSYSFTYKGKSFVACEPTAKSPRLGYSNFNLKRVTRVIEL